jgi:hypothetical protein
MNRRSFIQRLAWLPTLGVASKAEASDVGPVGPTFGGKMGPGPHQKGPGKVEPKIAEPVPDVDLTDASLERMLREMRKQIHDNAALAAKPRRVLIL